jgi:hypothetical protein
LKSLFYYKQLIKHYGSATLIDVLHSPFVFALYNDCIKKKSNVQLSYFVPQSKSYLQKRAETIVAKVKSQNPNHLVATTPEQVVPGVRYLFFMSGEVYLPALQKVLLTMHNDSVIIVRDMYVIKENEARWKALQQLEGVTASVDLFVLGFVFVRKEQRRQTFRLRIL